MTRLEYLYLAGEWVQAKSFETLISPIDDQPLRTVPQAGDAEVEAALAKAWAARAALGNITAVAKRELFQRIARAIGERREDLKRSIVSEVGKSHLMADRELGQAIEAYQWASEEIVRLERELTILPSHPHLYAVTKHVAVGTVLALSPFNIPTYFVHKLIPALAVGAPVILKPPPAAPGAAQLFAEIYEAAAVPAGALSVLPCSPALAERMAVDERVGVVSFTGSNKVGERLAQVVPRRTRLALELGANDAAIVHEDADVGVAAQRCAFGGFMMAGQLCVSVQRIFVHRPIFQSFLDRLVAEVSRLKVGDPRNDPDVVVGPLVQRDAAARVEAWLAEAVAGGAKLLCGGRRRGNFVEPAVVVNAKRTDKIWCEEVFGPVVAVTPYDTFEEALAAVNESRYGLQAGVFTNDVRRLHQAFERLDVGAVVHNEGPTFRSVNYPFGGMKRSGSGRENIRWSIDEYSVRKTLILNTAT